MKTQDGTEDCPKENDNNSYSFQQRSLVIPAFTTNMDTAVLQTSLIGPSSHSKLPPLRRPENLLTSTSEADSGTGVSDNNDFNDSAIAASPILSTLPLVPHPPPLSKSNSIIKSRKKISALKNADSFSQKVDSDPEANSNSARVSDDEGQQRLTTSDVDDIIHSKLEEENSLLNSYEDYLRSLSKEEEDEVEETTDNNCSLDSDDSSSESFSISSLSDTNEDDKDDSDDSVDHAMHNKSETFQPLYSLPMKSKNNNYEGIKVLTINGQKNDVDLEASNTSMYATSNQTLMCTGALRTQSAPDLRKSNLMRTSDTLGYMCPVNLPRLEGNQPSFSSPELKDTAFRMKYRPLPSIPMDRGNLQQDKDEDGIYEPVATTNFSQSLDSPSKSKISFKSVADRVVSLMPRLTTREARSRESDQHMADILRYLPDKKLRIFVGTWNMKGMRVLPDNLDDYLLPSESIFIQDIYVIGCQEGTPFRKEWEICLQETLGPTHVLMYSGNFGVLQLSIFVRRELVWFCSNIEQDTVATRIAHKIKTKGAIAVSFNVFGTSLLFINSHFASDQQKLQERILDYRTICRSLSMPYGHEGDNANKQADVTSRFDRVFWFGDFNFRVNKTRAETDALMNEKGFEGEYERQQYIIQQLYPHDQLQNLLSKGKIFQGFQETEIDFLPTYKFDVNTDNYDTSAKKRIPSWTDRVLYRSKQPDQIHVSMYDSCRTIKGSDHRPVFAVLEANIEPVKKNVMLPCAMFDREIYVEANMRRSAPKGNQQSSNVCVIL
eukprot:gene15643-17222_t